MANERTVSQEELNSLLAALSASVDDGRTPISTKRGSTRVHEARVHDFARTDQLSPAALHALVRVHTAFAASAGNSLSTYLHAQCRISLLSLDQLTYEQFQRSVPDPTVIAVFDLAPLPGKGLMEVNQSIGLWTVDRLLGGEGELPALVRPLTQVENALVESALSRMLAELREAWKKLVPIEARLLHITHSAAGAEMAEPADPVIVTSFEVNVGNLTAMASLCFPASSLRLARGEPAGLSSGPRESPREPAVPAVLATLLHVPVCCTVQLGTIRLSAAELSQLVQGDVVCLDQSSTQPLTLLVEGVPRFHCRPFSEGDKLVAEITGPRV